MSSVLDSIRSTIDSGTPVETPDGPMIVIFDGKREGVRLMVDPERGLAIASRGEERVTYTHDSMPAIAAIRALTRLVGGGVA